MKKKWMLILAGMLLVSTLAACGKPKELSNDNITIAQYKGFEVEKTEPKDVTEEDVEQEIQAILYANRIMDEVTDRGAEETDLVALDYTGTNDGEVFDEGTLEVEIGSGRMIPGFEDGLIGHKVGEEFDMDITFPENYTPNPALSGAPAVFSIRINFITSQEVPELNDEFVKSVSETSSNVKEYRKQIKEELKVLNERDAEELNQNRVWNKILEQTKVNKYPKDAVEDEIDRIIVQYTEYAESQGYTFEEFLDEAGDGMTVEDFRVQAEDVAKTAIKQYMIVDMIMETEKLELSKEELEKILEEYRVRYAFETVDKMKEEIGEDFLMEDINLTTVKRWAVKNSKLVKQQ